MNDEISEKENPKNSDKYAGNEDECEYGEFLVDLIIWVCSPRSVRGILSQFYITNALVKIDGKWL